MPRGGKSKGQRHKGRPKRYLTAEEIRAEEERKKKESEWKRKKGKGPDEEEESEEEVKEEVSRGAEHVVRPGDLPPDSSDDEEDDDEEEEEEPKAKGVEGLIEISNPNRVVSKAKKATDIDINAKVELSRREREEIARQQSAASYRRMHEAGKTEEAQRDLARLAIIRQQREEVAKKKEAERKAKEAAEAAAKQKQKQKQKTSK